MLGICGTAMAAIASLAKSCGWYVTGSDSGVYPPMSTFLQEQQIDAFEGYDANHLQPRPDLVLVGNAMSRGNVEVEALLDDGIPYISGPEFVGRYLLPNRHSIVVAGTHGKTSTSSLMAHVLEQAGLQPGFMIGGVPENFSGGAKLGTGAPFVLEGDEYDTAFFDKRSKFLHYRAETLILNNLEYDHADIFPDLESIKKQFQYLLRTVPSKGLVVVNGEDEALADVIGRGCWSKVVRFSEYQRGVDADWQWQALAEDGSQMRLWYQGETWLETRWSMIGRHHVANGCAVAAVAHAHGLSAVQVKQGFETFLGVRRRMTLVGTAKGVAVYDDFAHHPTAIAGVVASLKARLLEAGRLWVVVEPRSNTMRTKIHEQRLPGCFLGADFVRFVPPSQRNLSEDEVLDAEWVCRVIDADAEVLADAAAIIDDICTKSREGDAVLILSNGGFEGIHQRLVDALQGNG